MSLVQTQAGAIEIATAAMEPEHELIERVARDREAFGAFYERYCPMLSAYVYRRTGDVHATEDLVADVFLIVIRKISGYRCRGIPVRFWLMRIATNVVNRWARRQRRGALKSLKADELIDESGSSSQGAGDEEHLQRALLSLPPRYQAVLALCHLEGLSGKEASAILGIREGTVRSRLARARDALRMKLSERRQYRARS